LKEKPAVTSIPVGNSSTRQRRLARVSAIAGRRPVEVARSVKELPEPIVTAGWWMRTMAKIERISPIANGVKNIIPLWPTLFPKMIRASGESIQLREMLPDIKNGRAIVGSCY